MARYKYRTPDANVVPPTTNVGLNATAEKKRQNYLSGKEAYADDYNQTVENLKKERAHRGMSAVQLPVVTAGQSSMKASQLTDLRAATKGLVSYNGSDTFPWHEEITALVTRLKARHLEEVRQAIDDALNNARCSGCSSECGQNCGNGCVAVCRVTCGDACSGGCSTACHQGCGNTCGGGCTDACAGHCGSGCTATCGGGGSSCGKSACENACSASCSGDCAARCTGTCDGAS